MAKKATLSDTDRRQLMEDLREAEGEWARAECDGQPHEAAFRNATAYLGSLPPQPQASKEVRLAAYDERVRAGHAWHPYKMRQRKADAWMKAIRAELKSHE
jgi:hypothetical protein